MANMISARESKPDPSSESRIQMHKGDIGDQTYRLLNSFSDIAISVHPCPHTITTKIIIIIIINFIALGCINPDG